MIHSYKDLIVWKKAVELSIETYKLTEQFPKEEMYGLTSQMRRASVSIPSNIAEGRYRGSRKDFMQFLRIAYSSGAELETQIEIAKRLSFSKDKKLNFIKIDTILSEVMKMLHVMMKNMNVKASEATEANPAN